MPYGKSWKEAAKRYVHCLNSVDVWDGAAALAYYFMLAIFPAMIFLLALLPFLPIPNLDQEIMGLLSQAMPGEAHETFTGVVTQITSNKKGGLLSLGILLTLWSASNGIAAVMHQFNRMGDAEEERSYLKMRAVALALTLGAGLLIAASFAVILVGNLLIDFILRTVGLADQGIAHTALTLARWAIVAVGMMLAFGVLFRYGPTPRIARKEFKLFSAGNIASVLFFVLASLGFKLYVSRFSDYNATYGSIGAVIVLMLWMYVTGLVILMGAQIDVLQRTLRKEQKEALERRSQESRPGRPREVA